VHARAVTRDERLGRRRLPAFSTPVCSRSPDARAIVAT
jgi:hypothetical protein